MGCVGERSMSNVFIRSLCVDDISVHLEGNDLTITIKGQQKLKAERYEDGWLLWDIGVGLWDASQCLAFENFQLLWEHIQDLAEQYDLFPAQWKNDHYEMLCCLFKSVV